MNRTTVNLRQPLNAGTGRPAYGRLFIVERASEDNSSYVGAIGVTLGNSVICWLRLIDGIFTSISWDGIAVFKKRLRVEIS